MTAKLFNGQLSKGKTVIWYHSANPTSKGVPAIVYEGYGGGVADLLVLFPDAGVQIKRSVYHMSSPSLRFPETGLLTDNAKVHGGWDFCEFDQPEEVEAEKPSRTAKK